MWCLPVLNRTPQHAVLLTYDAGSDTFSVNHTKPGHASDSEMTDDDVIIRYESGAIIGFTVLYTSRRTPKIATDESLGGSRMKKEQVLSLLAGRREDMLVRFGVKKLGVFGSAARDDMRSGSDVDILVEFQDAATFDNYMDLKAYLEALLGTAVDLVTEEALKPRMRPVIEKDLVRVA